MTTRKDAVRACINRERAGHYDLPPPSIDGRLCHDCLNESKGLPPMRVLPQWESAGPPPQEYGVDGNFLLDDELKHWFKIKGKWVR